MNSLEAELERARALAVDDLAAAIESIGFECTRCGACCRGVEDEEHTATVFPDEVRDLTEHAPSRGADQQMSAGSVAGADGTDAGERDAASDDDPDAAEGHWRDVARPMPYGLQEDESGTLEGETFEWALQTDACGDCVFYEEHDGVGACAAHDQRPLICRTYPFSVALAGTSQPMGEAVDEDGLVRAHECEGLGRDISRADAEELARALQQRAVRELEEAIAVRDNYAPVAAGAGDVIVHDSEGAKRPDGTRLE